MAAASAPDMHTTMGRISNTATMATTPGTPPGYQLAAAGTGAGPGPHDGWGDGVRPAHHNSPTLRWRRRGPGRRNAVGETVCAQRITTPRPCGAQTWVGPTQRGWGNGVRPAHHNSPTRRGARGPGRRNAVGETVCAQRITTPRPCGAQTWVGPTPTGWGESERPAHHDSPTLRWRRRGPGCRGAGWRAGRGGGTPTQP
jgi:hypothetical protein